MASELHWPERGIRLRQETQFPEEEATSLTLQCEKPVVLVVNIRVPYWAAKGVTIKVNGKPQAVAARPSSYIVLRRKWMNGDKVEVTLPMSLHVHAMPDDATLQAMMYGPLLLVGRLGAQGLTKEMMYGGSGPVPPGEAVPAPTIVGDARNPVAWLERGTGEPLTFHALGQSQPITLVPFYKLWGERYATYWKVRV